MRAAALVTEPEKYTGEWLRFEILELLPPTHVIDRQLWKEHVEAQNGGYGYDAVVEAYGNLTRTQMKLAEAFLTSHETDPRAAAILARAAYDASMNRECCLSNTVFLYDDLTQYSFSPTRNRFDKEEHCIYRVVRSFRKDITKKSREQQDGIRAVAQFTLANFGSEQGYDDKWVRWTYDTSTDRDEVMVYLADDLIRECLQRHPDAVDRMLSIKEENPEITATALAAIIEGDTTAPLAGGAL